jgi:hypothetical protein
MFAQSSLGRLGKKPRYLGTDHSSAATHEIHSAAGPRAFNLCEHYDLRPVTINVASPHEHGDVESQNRHLKRRLKQHLLLRGSSDFADESLYDQPACHEAEYREVEARVSSHSTIRVKNITYSVPVQIFKDPMTTMAAVDRLVHHAVILEFDNESIRATEARSKATAKTKG